MKLKSARAHRALLKTIVNPNRRARAGFYRARRSRCRRDNGERKKRGGKKRKKNNGGKNRPVRFTVQMIRRCVLLHGMKLIAATRELVYFAPMRVSRIIGPRIARSLTAARIFFTLSRSLPFKGIAATPQRPGFLGLICVERARERERERERETETLRVHLSKWLGR